jgi:hypothetical protein
MHALPVIEVHDHHPGDWPVFGSPRTVLLLSVERRLSRIASRPSGAEFHFDSLCIAAGVHSAALVEQRRTVPIQQSLRVYRTSHRSQNSRDRCRAGYRVVGAHLHR